MEEEIIFLKWNDFQSNISTSVKEWKSNNDFTDVTLALSDGELIEAHRFVLAASSPVFKSLLKKNQHPHPIVYLHGLKKKFIHSLLQFMYYGEVSINQSEVNQFIASAQELNINGLTFPSDGIKQENIIPNIQNEITINPDFSINKDPLIATQEEVHIPGHSTFPETITSERFIPNIPFDITTNEEILSAGYTSQHNTKYKPMKYNSYGNINLLSEDTNAIYPNNMYSQPQNIRSIHQPVARSNSQSHNRRVNIAETQVSHNLQDFLVTKQSEDIWRCNVCPLTANTEPDRRNLVEEHIKTHLLPLDHPCHLCGMAFKSRTKLMSHTASRHS